MDHGMLKLLIFLLAGHFLRPTTGLDSLAFHFRGSDCSMKPRCALKVCARASPDRIDGITKSSKLSGGTLNRAKILDGHAFLLFNRVSDRLDAITDSTYA
jgi:hypothetical protein